VRRDAERLQRRRGEEVNTDDVESDHNDGEDGGSRSDIIGEDDDFFVRWSLLRSRIAGDTN
jgi:hypothetical protein